MTSNHCSFLSGPSHLCILWNVPTIPNVTQSQKLPAAGKTMFLLEHKVNDGQLLWTVWSSPTSPHLGLKHCNTSVFKETKLPEFSLQVSSKGVASRTLYCVPEFCFVFLHQGLTVQPPTQNLPFLGSWVQGLQMVINLAILSLTLEWAHHLLCRERGLRHVSSNMLCGTGWLWTPDRPASPSRRLELWSCVTTPIFRVSF